MRTPSEMVPAFALSGGNQQKLLVGRELASRPAACSSPPTPRVVSTSAPRRPSGTSCAVARDAGLAVLLISADLDELIGLSDRILVMFDGRITARLDPGRGHTGAARHAT